MNSIPKTIRNRFSCIEIVIFTGHMHSNKANKLCTNNGAMAVSGVFVATLYHPNFPYHRKNASGLIG